MKPSRHQFTLLKQIIDLIAGLPGKVACQCVGSHDDGPSEQIRQMPFLMEVKEAEGGFLQVLHY